MTTAAIAELLTLELCRTADQAAADATLLVSITIDMIQAGAPASVTTRTERKTRTMIFLSGDAFDADGQRLATATAVFRIEP